MAADTVRQSHLSSLGLKEHTFTALWDIPRPEGPFCFRDTENLFRANALTSREPVVNLMS